MRIRSYPIAPRLETHRLIDADGMFYCASNRRDCERLLSTALNGAGRVELNENPIWVNEWREDFKRYHGPETLGLLWGHPITPEERELVDYAREVDA